MSTTSRKSDADEIRQFLLDLQSEPWLKSDRSWWPQFAFHFTDLRNAVNILECGRIYSRNRLNELGIQFVDGASPEMIERTSEADKSKVRFFFRPRTPTQYRNEGVRPANQIQLHAHVPIPVFLLFDLVDLLTRLNCTWSNRSVATTFFDEEGDIEFLRSMPFKDIYHNSFLPEDENRKRELVARRHAEILIPDEVELDCLKEIHCRSKAEKDTLLFLLSPQARAKWFNNAYSDGRRQLFYKRWTYVDQVSLGRNHIQIRFSPDTLTSRPFHAVFEIIIPGQNPLKSEVSAFDSSINKGLFTLPLPTPLQNYQFRITLDDHLVYHNEFVDYDIPF